jgi:hypothetical protein
MLAFVLAVIVVALVGGFIPAVLGAVAGSLLLYFFAVAQPDPEETPGGGLTMAVSLPAVPRSAPGGASSSLTVRQDRSAERSPA